MTRTIDAATLAVYRSASPTTVPVLTITRTDAQVFRWIGHDRDLPIGGQTYTSAPGIEISSLVSSEGFAVDNAEFKVLDADDPLITRADLLAGVWFGAQMDVGMVDWKAATPVIDVLKRGFLGIAKPRRGYVTLEFRDLRYVIQDTHAAVLQPTCRYRVGVRNAVSHCPVVLADYTVTGTLSGVTSQSVVTDSARTEAADWFGEGFFRFTSGLNANLPGRKIKTYAAGVFGFWEAFTYPISDTDEYEASAGCRLRFQEDCIGKFDVGIDFGGEPNKRNPDVLSAPATAS